jgi:hypothetical protein
MSLDLEGYESYRAWEGQTHPGTGHPGDVTAPTIRWSPIGASTES